MTPHRVPSFNVLLRMFLVLLVQKYLVYNKRKRGGDTADAYFQRTESVAGVKDARFQALMPDVLQWVWDDLQANGSVDNFKPFSAVGSESPRSTVLFPCQT